MTESPRGERPESRTTGWRDVGPGSVTASHDDGCECDECLRRRNQQQPRMLAGTSEPRISRADEQAMTDRIRRTEGERRAEEHARQVAELERRRAHVRGQIDAALDAVADVHRAIGRADRDDYRLIAQARRSLVMLKKRQHPADSGVTPGP